MKKIIYSLLVLVSFLGTAQNVYIPDVVFKQALLLSNSLDQQVAFDITGNPMVVDVNQDGEIQETEALDVYGLDLAGNQDGLFLVEGNPITDLTGLSAFLNLRNLDISTNQLTGQTIDVTIFSNLINFVAQNSSLSGVVVNNMTTLKKIDVTGNYITQINLTGLTSLQELSVDSNQIQNLDFSDTASLVKLNTRANPLTTLNWAQLTQLTDLNVSLCNQITSVELSSLVNLKTVSVASTGITSLDVSTNVLLTDLDCSKDGLSQTSIANLNVSTLINLKRLICSNNQLNNLDVSGLVNLEFLDFMGCNIANPIFGNNVNLHVLECSFNQITTLDLSLFPALQQLSCIYNNLTALDFSSLTNLNYVSCSNNQFQSLDFSNNPNFYYLELGTNLQLEYLNIKNNATQIFGFEGEVDLPNLVFICADEDEIPFISIFGLSQNVVINSYCSFVPGGNYNTITGKVAIDINQNGCDENDIAQPYVKVSINDGNNQGAVFTDALGNYTFYVQNGTYVLSTTIENETLFTINGQNTSVEFSDSNNNNTANVPFCISPIGSQSDLEVVISPFSFPLAGGENYYQIYYRNKGNQTLSGNINFIYDTNSATYLQSFPAENTINTDGSLGFDFTNLVPFESRTILVGLALNGTSSQNPVQAGDVLQFVATGTITEQDINPTDNQFIYNQTIEDFMLENSIICIEGQEVNADLIGDYLNYSINFENTSSQTSSFIVIRATINPDEFDINSLQLLMSSSNVEIRVTGNLLEIIFTNLQLESGGHGNVLLRMKTQNQLQPGDKVAFETTVYFNEIQYAATNKAETTFKTSANLGIDTPQTTSVSVYPNPTKSTITIADSKDTLLQLQLMDIQGRILETIPVNQTSYVLDISQKLKGIYFLKVTTTKGSTVEKIIKE